MAKEKSTTEPAEPSFEESLAALEDIVHALEEGQIGLADALARYEQGVKLLRQCYNLLAGAERKIELLGKVDAQGVASTEPFDDSPSTSAAAPARSARRSRTTRAVEDNFAQTSPDEIDDEPTLF